METIKIKQVLTDQQEFFRKEQKIIERDIPGSFINSKKISVISGVRRSGKSTLLKQISKKFDNFCYFNFDDERLLDFNFEDFNALLGLCLEIFDNPKVFFFDEIQNITGWEKFARRLFEQGFKVFITGSNAKLLSSEMATSLTGRHLKKELYPFSFKEFLKFHNFQEKKSYTTAENSKLKRLFNQYLELGGFPEVLKSKNKEELKQIYEDILFKDLIVRFKIRDVKSFRELLLYSISNLSKKISFNNLKNLFEFGSASTVKDYMEFFERVYLIFPVYLFDYSLRKQIKNDRKIYSIDTGLAGSVAFSFSENRGRLLENIVFLELRRRGEESYYFTTTSGKEIDFLVRKGTKVDGLIQVSCNTKNKETLKRETDALFEAMEEFNLNDGLLLSEYEEKEIKKENKKIKIMPIYKWLIK